ncbi:MAG: phosphate signaling complex protein PhoU [Caldilineales bacterium]|nr:phosphate signaling complex protein PhoU [Caldilineales bacterium]
MLRQTFENEMHHLEEQTILMSDMVEQALMGAMEALKTRDIETSKQIRSDDKRIDALRYEIEDEAMTLIATQQPMAGDMRFIAAALFIANELERIGDYAKGLCRINIRIGDEPLIKPLIDLPRMAIISQSMLHRSVQAFVQRDVAMARAIILEDELVDDLYEQIYRELITLLFEDPQKLRQSNLLLFAAHNLERAADRATNICERVIFCVTGHLEDVGSDEDDISGA